MSPSKDWKEVIPEGESAHLDALAERLVTLQRLRAKGGAARRALHAKGHRGFTASLEVHADLPEPARQGLFARPGTYEALVRYSNGAGLAQPDKVGDVRGLAVKVLGVGGPKVLGEADTQDFLAIHSSATPFRNADEFVAVVWATRSPPLALFRLIGALGLFRPFAILTRLLAGFKGPPVSLGTRRFFSALPIQCGPYAARFAFTPSASGSGSGSGGDPLPPGTDFFADDLAARLRKAPLAYDLSLQFFVDEARTPIEDGSVDWPEDISPYVQVGRLVIPTQDTTTESGRAVAACIEELSFDPWHALVGHRPLGNMMRARKHAYFASTQGRVTRPEPASLRALVAA